jgi:hypothetical protein
MRIIGVGLGVLAVLAVTSVASASTLGLVANGDFEEGYQTAGANLGNTPVGWNSYNEGTDAAGSGARFYSGAGYGEGGTGGARMRVVLNKRAGVVMWQEIAVQSGQTYQFTADWYSDLNQSGWWGAFFFSTDTTDRATIEATIGGKTLPSTGFIPYAQDDNAASGAGPHRFGYGTNPDDPTDMFQGSNHEIVAEHAVEWTPAVATWQPISSADAVAMTVIGDSSYQTKVATGNYMVVGFFLLDDPGSAQNLYVDNAKVELVPEPATLVLLAMGGVPLLLRRRR